MRALVTTVDGWSGAVRSSRWSPLVVTPVVACATLVLASAAAGPVPGLVSLGEVGLAFTAVAYAFVADDAALNAAPATPVEARARLAARAVVMAPVAVLGWLLVLAVCHWVIPIPAPAARADLAGRALAGVGLGSSALALATLGATLPPVASPGAAGMGAMVLIGAASTALPEATLARLPPAEVLWPTMTLLAVPVIVLATRNNR